MCGCSYTHGQLRWCCKRLIDVILLLECEVTYYKRLSHIRYDVRYFIIVIVIGLLLYIDIVLDRYVPL
jgi:hypothetical protein